MGKFYNKLFLGILLVIVACNNSFATTRTANASGAWSTTTTWSPAGTPVAGDVLTIAAGYTVTLDASTDQCGTLTISGGALSGTTFTLTVGSGGVTITTGTLSFTSGTLNDAGSFADNATFTFGTSTVNMNGTTAQTLGGTSGPTFYNLTVHNTGAAGAASTVTLNHSITVNNVLTLTSGTLDVSASNYNITLLNTFTNNASLTAFNGETGTVTFSSSSTINGSSGTTFYALVVSAGGSAITLTATTQPITITDNLSLNSGGGTCTLTVNTNTITVGGNVTVNTNGVLTFTTGSLNVGGNYTCNGTFNSGTGTTTFNGTSGTQTLTGGGSGNTFYDLTSNPSAGVTVSLANAITINDNFIVSQGTFNCAQYQITGASPKKLILSANTTLILGSKTVATAVAFPIGFPANKMTIDYTSTVVYEANTNQTISSIAGYYGNLTITAGTAPTTNKPDGAISIFGTLLIQDGTGGSVVTFDENSYTIGLHGNLTDNGILLTTSHGGSIDSLCGTSGVQALSSTEATGLKFYDLVVANTSGTSPGMTTTAALNVSDNIAYSSGNLDLKGNNFNITTASKNDDLLSGGTIITSVAGSNFNVTDPDTALEVDFYGTWIGNQNLGITINAVASSLEFQSFTEYGTASFEKVGANVDAFKGGNGFHGPVTFTAYRATQKWRFGSYSSAPTLPDTFYNCTINAAANSTGNDNFIISASNTSTFNGTTTITSSTPGGVFFSRSNGGANSNITFNGPVICNIGLTGNVTFGDAGSGISSNVTFNSTIQLNSTAASTGYYYFGNNALSTITLSSTGEFIGTGTIQGKSNVYLENVTQNGTTLTQTINTAGSTGFLEIGGATKLSKALPCTFNAPCVFSADTAGYIVGAAFGPSAALTFNVNHPSANGYLISNTFNGTVSATIGEMRIQSNTFNATTNLTETNTIAADSSVNNGGNTFNAPVTVTNTGSAFLYFSQSAPDYYNSDVTFALNGPCVMGVGANSKAYFAGNITVTGTAAYSFYFGYYYNNANGGMVLDGTGTQVLTVSGSVVTPLNIRNITMAMTGAGTNIFKISNFNVNVAGVLTFSPGPGNTGLINLNGNSLTIGYDAVTSALCTVSYPSASTGTPAGWIYGGTVTRDIAAGTLALPAGATATTTAGFFPIGSSPTLNVFQPIWVSFTGGSGVSTAGVVSVSQSSNASSYSSITPYTDASMGHSITGVSNANWSVGTSGFSLSAGAVANIEFGGFGFQYFVDADVNASYATTYAVGSTHVTAVNLWGATDLEVERTGLTLAQLAANWHIGTDNITASPLPIQLTSFTADCNNYAAAIKWTTATETNNDFFTVDKTQDGYNFNKVLDVKGAGTTSTQQNYSILDQSPFSSTSYYRLSQTDLDGKTTIVGTTVYVPCENENEINSFAHSKTVKVEINVTESAAYTITLLNTLGQQVVSQHINANPGLNVYSLTPNLANGIYVVHVAGANTNYTKKVALGLL